MAKTKIEQLREQAEKERLEQEEQQDSSQEQQEEQQQEELSELDTSVQNIKNLENELALRLNSVQNLELLLQNRLAELSPPTQTQQELARKDPNYSVESITQGHEIAAKVPHVPVLPLETGAHCLGPVIYQMTKGVRTNIAYPLAVSLATMKPPLVTLL